MGSTARGGVQLDGQTRELLEDYVRSRGSRLLRTAYLISGDRGTAEDLVQSALAALMVSSRRLPDIADLDAYLYRSMVNVRHRWWRRRSSGEIPVDQVPDRPVEDGTARVDRYADMIAVLRSLPPRQRAAVVLRYYEDLSEAQTAQVLGCSIGTVKSQTSDGLAKLRAALGAGALAAGPLGADAVRGAAPGGSLDGVPATVRPRAARRTGGGR